MQTYMDITPCKPPGNFHGPRRALVINDLPNASKLSSWLFADDTALAMSSKNLHDLETKFNYEVNRVHDWLLANRLTVHYKDKTQFMLIYGPHLSQQDENSKFGLRMGRNEIERTHSYKYLGITLSLIHISEPTRH